MSRNLFTIAVIGLLTIVSCSKENNASEESFQKIVLRANIEDSSTKASLSSTALQWATTDKIGVVVSNGSNSWCINQQFSTTESGASVDFTSDVAYSGSDKWDYAAFFPYRVKKGDGDDYVYNGIPNTGVDKNAYGQTVTYRLPEGIYGYESGQVLMPMVADMSGGTIQPTAINFKYLGGGVALTLSNLPAGAHSIGMTVDGQKVFGEYSGINPANAGSAVLAQASSVSDNTVWLNFASDQSKSRSFTFVFPVPLLNTPKISFHIYDDNDICGWSVNLKAQTTNIGRAEVLDFGSKSITYDYYAGFAETETWDVCGTFTSSWGSYLKMEKHPSQNWYVKENVTLSTSDEFKIRLNHDWAQAYPASNKTVPANGTYDILFNSDSHAVILIEHGKFPKFN